MSISYSSLLHQLRILLCFMLMLLIFSGISHSFFKPLGIYDEGFTLTNALRIMNGEAPHRDYWAAYPPGTSYVLAFAFTLAEPSLLVARVVNLMWTILLILSLYYALHFFVQTHINLIITTACSLWVAASLYPSYSVIPAVSISFMAISNLLKAFEQQRTVKFVIVAGASGSLSVLPSRFRQDIYFSRL